MYINKTGRVISRERMIRCARRCVYVGQDHCRHLTRSPSLWYVRRTRWLRCTTAPSSLHQPPSHIRAGPRNLVSNLSPPLPSPGDSRQVSLHWTDAPTYHPHVQGDMIFWTGQGDSSARRGQVCQRDLVGGRMRQMLRLCPLQYALKKDCFFS